jgi:radical SAM-linked protein
MYRLAYSKEGLIKFISHLDLIRLWQRAFRRAGLSVKVSQGFSPHPLISFGPPLPVGVAGRRELLDVTLTDGIDPARLQEGLQSALPEGIRVNEVRIIRSGGHSLCTVIDRATYEVELSGSYEDEAREKVAAAQKAASIVIRKKTGKGERFRDIKPLIAELKVEKGEGGKVLMRFTTAVGERGNLNPHDLLGAVLDWPAERVKTLPVTRTAIFSSGRH